MNDVEKNADAGQKMKWNLDERILCRSFIVRFDSAADYSDDAVSPSFSTVRY